MNEDDVVSLINEFAVKSEPLGVTVQRVPAVQDAADAVAGWVREFGAGRLLVAGELAARSPVFVETLAGQGIEAAPPGPPDVVRDSALGVSLAHLAVAETGSTLLAEPTLEDRSIGMLCLNQIIICPTASLVPSLDEAAPVLRRFAAPGAGGMTTLVTGPSRTADIERVLTVGVQGPGRIYVVFVDDL